MRINVDGAVLGAIGLAGVDEQQAKVAAACVLSRAFSSSEAALYLAGVDIVQMSDQVTYIDTHPPAFRTVRVTKDSRAAGVAAVALYCARPAGPEFDALTLPKYFERYEVRCALGLVPRAVGAPCLCAACALGVWGGFFFVAFVAVDAVGPCFLSSPLPLFLLSSFLLCFHLYNLRLCRCARRATTRARTARPRTCSSRSRTRSATASGPSSSRA